MQDFTGLSSLNIIGGYLRIEGNTALTSLNGINNLTSIGLGVSIDQNYAMTSLSGLESLNSIGGDFFLRESALGSIVALANLNTVGGDFIIRCDILSTLNGLENLSNIPGTLNISFNNAITTLVGLDNLSNIGGELRIENNISLSTLTGLESLTSIGECLTIKGNIMLNNLDGINNLTSIGSCFASGEGRSANNFNNVAITIGGLYEYEGNGNLYDFCSISSLVTSTEVSENELVIGQNLYNPTYTQVQDANTCANASLSINEYLIDEINVFPNPVTEKIIFKIDEQLIHNQQDLKLSIVDLTGRKVIRNLELQAETKIDVSTLFNGMYLYTISNNNTILKSGKLIKK